MTVFDFLLLHPPWWLKVQYIAADCWFTFVGLRCWLGRCPHAHRRRR